MIRSETELLLDALSLCRDHYNNSFNRLAALDTKAQGTATVAGLLLAASAAFIPQAYFKIVVTAQGGYAIALALIVIGGSLVTILLSLLALALRSARAPYGSVKFAMSTRDLIRLPVDARTSELIRLHYLQQLSVWEDSIKDIAVTLDRKSRAIGMAQVTLAGASAAMASFISANISTLLV